MKYVFEMGSGAMIYTYIPSFVNIGSGIGKLIWSRYTETQTAWSSHKPTFIFFNKESGLKRWETKKNIYKIVILKPLVRPKSIGENTTKITLH
jgi:hypothetical protein